MGKYNIVAINGFENEEDFRYVIKLLESTGWSFILPTERILNEIPWDKAYIYSSSYDPRRLYVIDADLYIENEHIINISELDKK